MTNQNDIAINAEIKALTVKLNDPSNDKHDISFINKQLASLNAQLEGVIPSQDTVEGWE